MIYPKTWFFKNLKNLPRYRKFNNKNKRETEQKKDLKDLLTFAYISIDYKATETNKHFYISFVNIASGKIYKNID